MAHTQLKDHIVQARVHREHGSGMRPIDWEWSRVMPRQFFRPPLWLYRSQDKTDSGLLVSNALENRTDIEWFACDCLNT
ncbi:Protein kinase-like domain [Apiospora saccharicola]|uniref:Protein kinase-like domain n=1 Tax=Apiospora saccharicola TaxID=335842 RepID=A0ABR1UPN6_9PEZI